LEVNGSRIQRLAAAPHINPKRLGKHLIAMLKRRTEITVETDRLLVIRGHKKVIAWCAPCARHREMLATDDAALAAHVKSSTIFHWAESGRIHGSETPEGLLLICPESLPHS
jgi:hypothetical protein